LKGYKVYRLTPNGSPTEEILRQMIDWVKPLSRYDLDAVGIPDFLCYNQTTDEYFFIEVKIRDDSLHLNQMRWMFKHKEQPYKLVYVVKDGQ
jgi:hypothetical protein